LDKQQGTGNKKKEKLANTKIYMPCFGDLKELTKNKKEKERRICLHELTSATQTCRSKRFYHLMVMLFQKRLSSSKRGVPLTVISDLGLVSRRRLAPTLLITWKKQNHLSHPKALLECNENQAS